MALRQTPDFYHPRNSVRVTDAAVEPVTLLELKRHLRITGEDDDYLLGILIFMARTYLEDLFNIAFISQTWQMTMDAWPGYREPWWDGVREGSVDSLFADARAMDIEIPVYPLISIDSINVYDEASNSTAVSVSTVFDIDAVRRPARLTLKRGQTWPIATRANNAIEMNYTAGYGTAKEDVPITLQRAVLEAAAYMYNHRGEGCGMDKAAHASMAVNMVRPYSTKRV